jgi:ABC-type Mn2+/Zn2+ transport system ATPase subunit
MSGFAYCRRTGAAAAVALVAGFTAIQADAQDKGSMRVAFGDVPGGEMVNFMIAVARAEERGVKVETSFLQSEELAAQAVVSGQADIGVGTPYALIQKVNAPIRMFYQLSMLRFFPVVNGEMYKSWEDLDGADIAVHGRGSGTEAIMQLMAKEHGVEFNSVSYVPGSGVRAGALLQGNINASIVDYERKRLLEREAPGKFIFLEVPPLKAIMGLIPVTRGTIRIGKEDVAAGHHKIGYVPQRKGFDRDFPALAVDVIVAALRGKWPVRIRQDERERARQILEKIGGGALIDKPLAGLSGGETQRVFLARALINDPTLIILDEPTAGVDARGRAELFEVMTSLSRSDELAAILVTHNLAAVAQTAERIVYIEAGRVLCWGLPAELLGQQSLTALAAFQGRDHHAHSHFAPDEE